MTDRRGDVDLVDDEFERLGRQAGAELREQPPDDGSTIVLRRARRRRTSVGIVAAGVTVAVVLAGLVMANSRLRDEPSPIATVPPAPTPTPAATPVVSTTVPSGTLDATPADAVRTTTPGTWRAVADPSSLAPEFPTAAVWTGTEVIVIGDRSTDGAELSPLSGAAYDVSQDRWRQVADPPRTLTSSLQWTGSAVLAATDEGEVYSYDPVSDQWDSRAAADESMSLSGGDTLVTVSARGVLARSSTGWWWYEDTTDRWEPVPAPSGGEVYGTLVALDQNTIAAVSIGGGTITSAVFDIASRSWRTGPPVEAAAVVEARDPAVCDANDGLLVCSAEGYGTLDGVVIDPLLGELDTFELGEHSNTLSTRGLPWMIHAWKLLSPRSATWEDLPASPYDDVDEFGAAAWTGSEIVFLGGTNGATGEALGASAAYTPVRLPGQ